MASETSQMYKAGLSRKRTRRDRGDSYSDVESSDIRYKPTNLSPRKRQLKRNKGGRYKTEKLVVDVPEPSSPPFTLVRDIPETPNKRHMASPSDHRSPQKPRKSANSKSNGSSGPLFLSVINYTKFPWNNLGRTHTAEIYRTFEVYENDFTPKRYIWNGHPRDRPQDVRARPLILQWATTDREPPSKLPPNKVVPVFRITYICMGNCANDLTELEEDWETDESDTEIVHSEESDTDSYASGIKAKTTVDQYQAKIKSLLKRRRVSVGNVQKGSNSIYEKKGPHNKAPRSQLTMSQYIRQLILEYAGVIKRLYRATTGLPKHLQESDTPSYRYPKGKAVENIVANARRQEWLLSDPLRAIGVFANNNPDKCFCYEYVTGDNPKFQVGLKIDYCIQTMLLYGYVNGVGLDSSYRNKNENRAPITFLTTVDKYRRMLPGDVKAETLVKFLEEVKHLVEAMASQIVEDPGCINEALSADRADLIREATSVVESESWNPLYFMIDKSRAEVIAIREVWPQMHIRLCQFHVVQAILRWETDQGLIQPGRPKLDRTARTATSVTLFSTTLRSTGLQNSGLIFGRTLDYLLAITEIIYLSTNNFTERAFKTFDQIFLENRANKSAYRLVLIIANEWFEYYRLWQPTHSKPDDEVYHQAIIHGHQLWNSGHAIFEMEPDSKGQRVFKVLAN
ncbi:hypothetical protein K435DRAFT_939190 [Dendrothele bispora CBS 962.96]|uniref:Uncharacterized protein n=1 Tax=Dendrothele bispora (strain CBS 962.96) TaxID=1314807 RepID=A0A4V4HBT9_DENBC|nr:hypothetical protein K435DRAFT_939190 [Dendrothele bispora CBS 962.96]